MTPDELYTLIKHAVSISDTTICQLHNPYRNHPSCIDPQTWVMLDFDEVEKRWHQQRGLASTDSVDALAHTGKTLCLIEMKGWQKFLEYQPIAGKEHPTAQQVGVLTQRIQKKTGTYQLQAKFLESVLICEEISSITDLPAEMSVAYILVTDIDPHRDAMTSLAQQLNMLAYTSTDWQTVCANQLGEHFHHQMIGVEHIHTYFEYCKRLDSLLAKI